MKCTKCGTEYEGNFCPKGCNSPYMQKPKKKNGCLIAFLSVVAGMLVFSAIMGIMFGEEQPTEENNITATSAISDTKTESKEETKKENPYETKKDLITFEGVKAEFVKVYDPKVGVTAFAVALNLNNTSNKEVTVTLTDGYVNDTKVQFMSGLPVTIASGKKAVGVYTFGYDGLGFSKIEEIEKMEFKISLLNESWSDMKTSKNITLNF